MTEIRQLPPHQYGFRKAHSTTHPILYVKNFIENELFVKKNHIVLLSIDLSKAFDTVDTDKILQTKIKYYTKDDKVTDWIDNFYKDRQQYTMWDNSKSELIKNYNISIVQGSSMGPKLFNIFLNDLPNASKIFETVLFADDSNFVLSNPNKKVLEKLVNRELGIIKDYFDSNGLSINISKTTFLHFCPKGEKKENLKIKLGNSELTEKEHLSFLGIEIDNKLTFKFHFKKVLEKVKKGLNGLILTKNQLNYRSKANIYHSLIHSHLSYGALIWLGNLNKKQIKELSTIQKKALRIIHNKKYNTHTDPLFIKSNITKVENIFEKESLLLIYKYNNNSIPTDTEKLIRSNF